MDIPQPPDDQEQRNIIDKLAQFVARNGPEFEKMTRVKQRKNPKFAFLFHGEFFNYYQYKVTTEQQILKQQQSRMSGTVGGGGNSQGPPPWQQQQQQQDATEPLPQNLPPWRKLPQGPSGGPTQNLPPWQQGPSPQAQSGAPPLPPWQQSGSPGGGPSQALPHPWQQGPPPPPWQQGPPPIGPGLGGVSPWPQGAPATGATLPPWQQASQVPSGAPPPWQQQGQGSPGQQGLTPWQQHPPAGASGNSGTEVCATGPQVQDQIQQSLQNLDQQQQHLMQQQQVLHPGAHHPLDGTEQIEAALVAAQEQRLQDQASDVQVDLEEFDTVLKPIIDSCTKDAISNGKTWIFSKAKSQEQCTLLADYLKWRIMKPGENFKLHLHLIYLINDVLHHCQRKQAQDLQSSLEKVVVPIFCTAFLGAEEEKQQKLSKLLALWEKNNYFEERIITQLKDPSTSLAQYQAWLVTEFASVVQPIHMSMQQQLKSLQMQHKHFVDHLTQGRPLPVPSVPPTLSPSDVQPTQTSEQGQLEGPSSSGSGSSGEQVPQSAVAVPGPTEVSLDISPSGQQPAFGGQQGNTWPSQQGPFNPQQPPPPWATNPASFGQPPPPPPPPPPPVGNYNQLPPPPGPGGFSQPPLPGFLHGRPPPMPPRVFASPSNDLGPPGPQCPPGAPNHPPAFQLGIPPPGLLEYAQAPPDFSKPPPGFPSIPPPNMSPKAPLQTVDPNDPSLLPTVPYYELPAGLMAPLVKLEECEYRPLDPTDIRLPPPMPPSDRLLEAVRAFYSPASHERPRNSEGWEHNGLYEFFRAKMRARRRRDEQSRNEGHSLSRSRSRSQRSSSSRSESSSSSSSRSHSRSPHRRRSYSRSRSRSRSPRHRRRSRSRSPRHRDSMSHAPPIGIADYRLGEENKGHQLLMKMGWSGAGGLGANEQGREDPIKGGEIRDHWNQYKGIGVPLDDPFENFRRSKSNTFIARLMARTDPLAGNQPTEKPTE